MTDQTPFSQPSKEPRLYGVIDVLRPDRVAGWVIDRTDPASSATIDVLLEGRVIGSVTANRPRKDLERQAVGTGCYGFAFALDPPLEEGMEFTVAVVARSHDGVELPLQPAGRAASAISAEKKALRRILAELTALRTDMERLRQELVAAEAGREATQERLELVQLRLERGISEVDGSTQGSPAWLAAVAVVGAVLAVGSLAVGLFSFWSL